MKCVHCQWRIYWNDKLSQWFHENNEEQCRVTFATPHQDEIQCVCGHSREYHALNEDVYSCFYSECKCHDFTKKGE